MSERSPDPRSLDVTAFCRQDGQLQGDWPLSAMPRLAAGVQALKPGAQASWSAQGSLRPVTGGPAEVWLHMQGRAEVSLECQRCLQPMTELLEVDRRFRFVRHEAEAAKLDEESEDDVLALPQRLDLHELLEDELILALPIVPRHGVCPQALPLAAEPEAEVAPNPFAALAALRGRMPRSE